MKSASDSHDDIVSAYIQVIKLESQEASTAIEEIRSLCGVRAALRATLVLTLVKKEFHENRSIPGVGAHNYLIKEFPEAHPLLEFALACCLRAWEAARNERLRAFSSSHGVQWIPTE